MSSGQDDDDDDECPTLVSAHASQPRDQQQPTGILRSQPQPEDQVLLDPAAMARLPTVPLVILSGFLASGKTTLLQYVLSAQHGMRLAVIVNEFEFGRSIEKGLTVRSAEAAGDEWMELRNGCMCCSAKSQSVQALEQLVARRRGQLDAILVETAGMADPVPIARSFWLDEALQAKVQLAGIVTIVDAANIERYVKGDKFVEAARQLLAADRIILNKADAVGSDVLFLDDQAAVRRAVFGDAAGGDDAASAAAASRTQLQRAAQTISEVNPAAPMILTSLKRLLQQRDAGEANDKPGAASAAATSVPIEKLRALLLLDRRDGNNDALMNAGSMWATAASEHSHTKDVCAAEVEVAGRAFKSVRDVDFFFAKLLENTVDGQDEHDEALPAQLRAREKGAVIVRSKAAVWVLAEGADEQRLFAVQVQSIGSTFEAVPMAGLNSIADATQRAAILPDGTNRMLLLGFGVRAADIQQALMDKTVALSRE